MKGIIVSVLLLLSLTTAAVLPAYADVFTSYQANPKLPIPADPEVLVCDVLGSIGVGCGSAAKTFQPVPTQISGYPYGNNTADSIPANQAVDSSQTASLLDSSSANGANKNNNVILVNVKGSNEIYAITNGQKRLIPTMDIFYDYKYKPEMIQQISKSELDRFPRVRIIQAKGDKKHTYYLTESGMVRLIPNDKVFKSYGSRKEDIVIVRKKEFNYYPRNRYVFVENPMNRDVYQLVDGKFKRYLTPVAVRRLEISWKEVAPISKYEFDNYRTEKPVVM